MKWAQQIRAAEAECLQGPHIELADHFLKYKDLKKLIKKMSQTQNQDVDGQGHLHELSFKSSMMSEMNRVSSFYRQKEQSQWDILTEKYLPRIGLTNSAIGFTQLLACAAEHRTDVEELAKQHASAPYAEVLGDLVRFYEKNQAYEKFALVNSVGICKAVKKHDKHSIFPLKKEVHELLRQLPIVDMKRLHEMQRAVGEIARRIVLHSSVGGMGAFQQSATFAQQMQPMQQFGSQAQMMPSHMMPYSFMGMPQQVPMPFVSQQYSMSMQQPAAPSFARTDPLPEMSMEAQDMAGVGQKREKSPEAIQIRPRVLRRKVGDGGKQALGGKPEDPSVAAEQRPLIISEQLLREHFNMPLNEAAKKIGICPTAVKKACRKMGIRKWPFQMQRPLERRIEATKEKMQREGSTEALRRELAQLQQERDNLLEETTKASFASALTGAVRQRRS